MVEIKRTGGKINRTNPVLCYQPGAMADWSVCSVPPQLLKEFEVGFAWSFFRWGGARDSCTACPEKLWTQHWSMYSAKWHWMLFPSIVISRSPAPAESKSPEVQQFDSGDQYYHLTVAWRAKILHWREWRNFFTAISKFSLVFYLFGMHWLVFFKIGTSTPDSIIAKCTIKEQLSNDLMRHWALLLLILPAREI